MNFEAVIDKIILIEGGYSDRASDHGGATMYGITAAVARANGYDGAMKELPLSLARTIYRNRYIVAPGFDKVGLCDEAIASELIDTGVNMGPGVAATFLQRWINAFNQGGSHYADVFVDGRIGEVTLASLRAYLRWKGRDASPVMVAALNAVQGGRYLELAEKDISQRDYAFGWIRGRVLAQAPQTQGTTP